MATAKSTTSLSIPEASPAETRDRACVMLEQLTNTVRMIEDADMPAAATSTVIGLVGDELERIGDLVATIAVPDEPRLTARAGSLGNDDLPKAVRSWTGSRSTPSPTRP
jgi:hypothetical protein